MSVQLPASTNDAITTKLAELVGRVSNEHFDGAAFDKGRAWAAREFTELYSQLGVPVAPAVRKLGQMHSAAVAEAC